MELTAAIVRILKSDGGTAGTGFIVSKGLILTCSHVLMDCDAQRQRRQVPAHVSFIFQIGGQRGEATVDLERWRGCDDSDLAALWFDGELPVGVKAVSLSSADGTAHKEFKTFGYPDLDRVGVWAYGTIGDPVHDGGGHVTIQLTRTTEITSGFSGGPVQDRRTKHVVGMVKAITEPDAYGRLTETAFMIPAERLVEAYPELELAEASVGVDEALAVERALSDYRGHVTRTLGTVRMYGSERLLDDMFVDLTIVEGHDAVREEDDWIGLLDPVERERRRVAEHSLRRVPELKTVATVNARALASRNEHAFVIGAPGSGKTTLLKFLAAEHARAGDLLPVFLDLKRVTASVLDGVGDQLAEVLFDLCIKAPLHLDPEVADQVRTRFYTMLQGPGIAALLDGLDEVDPNVMDRLWRCILTFEESRWSGSLIVSSRPYARRALGQLRTLEIAPLAPEQIRLYLLRHLDDASSAEQLFAAILQQRALLDLARIPFFLTLLAQGLDPHGYPPVGRLDLYRLLVRSLLVDADRGRGLQRYRIQDTDGSLKLRFLRQLAADLLLDEARGFRKRGLTIVVDELARTVQEFCLREAIPDSPSLLEDIRQLPLLREVNPGTWAFSHLTIQEFLAAEAMVRRDDCWELFRKSYHVPAVAELEVLPMVVGLSFDPEEYLTELEQLPESFTFINLRTRCRAMGYLSDVPRATVARLKTDVVGLVLGMMKGASHWRNEIYRRLAVAPEKALASLRTDLEALLENGPQDVRLAAASALALIVGERCSPVLVEALRTMPDIRDHLVHAMYVLRGPSFEDAVGPLLCDDDPELREAGARLLGRLPPGEGLPALLRHIMPRNPGQRPDVRALKEAVSWLEPPAAASVLLTEMSSQIKATDDEGLWGWFSTTVLLVALSGPEGVATLADLVTSRGEATDGTVLDALELQEGERLVPRLMRKLGGQSYFFRGRGARALERMPDSRIVPGLEKLTGVREEVVREMACVVLARRALSGDEVSHKALRQLLEKRVAVKRAAGVRALGAMCHQSDVPSVLALARTDRDSGVRFSALVALSKMREQSAASAFIHAMDDPSADVRRFAAWQLSASRHARGEGRLVAALSDLHSDVRQAAAESLGKMGARGAIAGLVNCAVHDADDDVRVACLDALGALGGVAQSEPLVGLLNARNARVTGAAMRLLAEVGDESVAARLLHVLEESGPAPKVVDALGRLRDRRAIPGLEAALLSGVRETVSALGQIGGAQAIRALIGGLASHSDEAMAAEIIAELQSTNATALAEVLVDCLTSESQSLRRLAISRAGYYLTPAMLAEVSRATLSSDESHLGRQVAEGGRHPVDDGERAAHVKYEHARSCRFIRAILDPSASVRRREQQLSVVRAASNLEAAHFAVVDELAASGEGTEIEVILEEWLECSKEPSNPHAALGWWRARTGRRTEAKAAYRESMRLRPAALVAYRLGRLYWEDGELASAEDALRKATELDDHEIEYPCELARLLVQMGRPEAAENQLGSALHAAVGDDEGTRKIAGTLLDLHLLDAAERAFRGLVAHQPPKAADVNDLGVVLERQERLAEAEKQYREACRLDGALLVAHTNLANVFERLGKVEDAVQELRQILEDPGFSSLRGELAKVAHRLGNLYRESGDFASAEGAFRKALELDTHEVTYRCELARLLVQMGRPEAAQEELESALQAVSEDSERARTIASTLLELHLVNAAERAFRGLVAHQPPNAADVNDLGVALERQERLAEAEEQFRAACRLDGALLVAHVNLANVLSRLGRAEDAIQELRQAVERPGFSSLRGELARVLLETDRAPEAVAVSREWRSLEPEISEPSEILVLSLFHVQDWPSAEAAAREWLDRFTGGRAALLWIAGVLWYDGRLEEARATYEEIVAADPAQIDGRLEYGQVLAELGRYADAIAELNMVVDATPPSASLAYALRGLGHATGLSGDYPTALAYFSRSIEFEPENAWVYLSRGLVHECHGNSGAARSDYETALGRNGPALPKRLATLARERIHRIS